MSYDILGVEPLNRVSLKVRDLSVQVKPQTSKWLRHLKSSNKLNHDHEKTSGQSSTHPFILQDISFDLNTNEMLALIGGSGSGKTTLLNTLSQRLNVKNKTLTFSGTMNYYKNGQLVQRKGTSLNHIKNSYLLQTDVFTPGLTTFEYLKFQADLQLPTTVSTPEKLQIINSLIDILEISHLKDSIIMNFSHESRLSGGEKRRVSLAVQLLNKPSILFLDEPTTGLDTSSSLKLVQVLRKLSSSNLGVTIILSIHQPRPEISLLFDKICLLTRGGRLVYYGDLVYSYGYFKKLNLPVSGPDETNETNRANRSTLETIMDLSVKDTSTKENETRTLEIIDKLVNNWKLEQSNKIEPVEPVSFESNMKVFHNARTISLLREILVLTKRTFILSYRDVLGLFSLIGVNVFLAIVCGWLFYKPPADLAGIRTYTSSLYVMLEVIGFIPLFMEIERLWQHDGILFFREYSQNQVSILGFIISRKLGKVLIEDLPISFAFGFISYFMFGLRLSESLNGSTDWTYFWNYLALTVLTYLIGMSGALACFALGPDFPSSAMIQNLFYQLQNSACGYYVNASTMPVYVKWIRYVCYFWYAFGALTSNQYTGWEGDCPYNDADQCIEYSGAYQLEVLGFPENWISEPMGILVAWLFGFYIISAIGLRFRSYDISMAKQKQNKIGTEEEGTEGTESASDSGTGPATATDKNEDQRISTFNNPDEKSAAINNSITTNDQQENISLKDIPVHIQLNDINLKVKKLRQQIQILNNITANFQANKVNVIMGPSGSGKTTLLNLISNRLPKTTRFKTNGQVKINGDQEIKITELSKIAGYVTQHDTSLIPHLTIRETFYYQALLRIPHLEHDKIPMTINKLIRQMGLLDCADTLIGHEYMKGISGGEKRRVSIGIQLLSKPKVLFLDEPTSGLDSTTSTAILGLLDKLTKENGTTIITTIHQPNNSMYEKFGSLLLLARGGFVVYNGDSHDIESYLKTINLQNPSESNSITDYILDIVTQGFDEDKQTSELRINHLIQEWRLRGNSQLCDSQGGELRKELIDVKQFKLQKLPFWIRFVTIFKRQLLSSLRSRDAFVTRATQVIMLGIVHALFFAPLKNDKAGLDNRLGLIQEVLNFYFIGLINNFAIFPIERDVFYHEFKDGVYSNFEFQICYFIIESLIEIITCLIFAIFIVFIIGLPRTAGMYFSMFFSCFVAINCGESLGIMINCIFDHLGLAINLLASLMTVAIFMGGTMSLYMPILFKALNYINPLKYAVGICAELSFDGQIFECPQGDSDCALGTGTQVLQYYGLSSYLPGYFGGLLTCLIVYRIVALMICEVKIRYFL